MNRLYLRLQKCRNVVFLFGLVSMFLMIVLSRNLSAWSLKIPVHTADSREALVLGDIIQPNPIAPPQPEVISLRLITKSQNKTTVLLTTEMTNISMTVKTHLHQSNDTPIKWPSRISLSAFSNILQPEHLNLSAFTPNMNQSMRVPYSSCAAVYKESLIPRYVFSNVYGKCDGYRENDISLLMLMDRESGDYIEKLTTVALNWRGPISTVIYYAYLNTSITRPSKDYFARDIENMFNKYDVLRSTTCVHAVYLSQKSNFFHINALRNIAMQFAPTDTILLSEADFIPQPALDEVIKQHLTLKALTLKRLYIVPVFGTPYRNYTMPANKKQLLVQWEAHLIVPITDIKKKYPFGHRPVNYKRFKSATEMYEVKFKSAFEPYYVVNRSLLPYYPEEFIWGTSDKYIHARLLKALGWDFYVLPNAFLVHTPHSETARKRKDKWKGCISTVANFLNDTVTELIRDAG